MARAAARGHTDGGYAREGCQRVRWLMLLFNESRGGAYHRVYPYLMTGVIPGRGNDDGRHSPGMRTSIECVPVRTRREQGGREDEVGGLKESPSVTQASEPN